MQVSTATRLKQIMRDRNLRQVDVIKLAEPYCKQFGLKLTKSDMSQFISGKVIPGQWKLSLLGRALNVSEAWLMGFDVPMERKDPAPANKAEQDEITKLFTSLSNENQKRLIDFAQVLLVAQQAERDSRT